MNKKQRLTLQANALNKVVECIEIAKDHYPQLDDRLDYIETLFDLRGKAAAQARYRENPEGVDEDAQVRINMEAYVIDPGEMLTDTIPHEVAHLVCFLLRLDKGHGQIWRECCIQLGGTGKQYHEMSLTSVRKKKMFLYVNKNGREIHFAQGRHSNLQLGKAEWYATSSQKWYKADFVSEVIVNPATGRIHVEGNEPNGS